MKAEKIKQGSLKAGSFVELTSEVLDEKAGYYFPAGSVDEGV